MPGQRNTSVRRTGAGRSARGGNSARLYASGLPALIPALTDAGVLDLIGIVPEGYAKCPECGRIVTARADGTPQNHTIQAGKRSVMTGGIPCKSNRAMTGKREAPMCPTHGEYRSPGRHTVFVCGCPVAPTS